MESDPGFGDASAVLEVLATLALTFAIGLEREEKRASDRFLVGGVRTIPIIGLVGHALVLVSPPGAPAVALGALALALLLAVEYHRRLAEGPHGATSEMATLAAYLVGALVASGRLPVATAVAVATVLLLHAKAPLERFAAELPRREIATLGTFLLIAAVVLPVLPDRDYTRFALNAQRTWLVVVVVSGISYASYLAQRVLHARQGLALLALLGGAYASTATTIVLARRARRGADALACAGATWLASAAMYVRVAVLVAVFDAGLAARLAAPVLTLAALATAAGGGLVALRRTHAARAAGGEETSGNPLELGSALAFGAFFLIFSVATQLASEQLGTAGVRALAVLAGIADIDPFVLGVAERTGVRVPLAEADRAILLAVASNNALKALYAAIFGSRRAGALAAAGLLALAGLTLAAALR